MILFKNKVDYEKCYNLRDHGMNTKKNIGMIKSVLILEWTYKCSGSGSNGKNSIYN